MRLIPLIKRKVPRSYSDALPIHGQKRARMGARKRVLIDGARDDDGFALGHGC